MKIAEYNQMMAYLTRPGFQEGTPKPGRTFEDKLRTLKSVSQGISPESRIRLLDYFIQEALGKGEITEEQASGIYDRLQEDKDKIREQIDTFERENFSKGTKKNFNRNPEGKNQFTANMRTFEEVQEAINNAPPKIIDGKEYPLTKKDLRGEGTYYKNKIVNKRELERFPDLIIPGEGKPITKPTSKLISNKKYNEFIKAAQGSIINMDEVTNFGHFAPKLKSFLVSTANTGPIGASVNRAAQGYDAAILKIAEEQERLILEKPKDYEKLLEAENAKAAKLSKDFNKLLPNQLKGTLGYFTVSPDGDFKLKGIDRAKTFAGISGEEKFFKLDMNSAQRKDFGKRQLKIQKLLDEIPELKKASNIERPEKALLRDQIKDFNIRTGGPTLGANLGLLKGLGETIKSIPTPTGTLALTAGFGVDSASAIDRSALGLEAALAPELVKQTSRLTSNPIVQRFFNLGLSPKMAMRLARAASPLGIASLIGEGGYQLYKAGKAEKAKLDAMTPEERRGYLAEQEEQMGVSA